MRACTVAHDALVLVHQHPYELCYPCRPSVWLVVRTALTTAVWDLDADMSPPAVEQQYSFAEDD
eukprot:1482270-Pleurochrysis_carterae.AAC.1